MVRYDDMEPGRRFRLLSEIAHRPNPIFRPQTTKAAEKREKARVSAAKREIAGARQELVRWYWDCVDREQTFPPGLQLEIDWLKRIGQGSRSFARLLSNPEGRPPTADEGHEITVATLVFLKMLSPSEGGAGLGRQKAIGEIADEWGEAESTVSDWVAKHKDSLRANAGLMEFEKHLKSQGPQTV